MIGQTRRLHSRPKKLSPGEPNCDQRCSREYEEGPEPELDPSKKTAPTSEQYPVPSCRFALLAPLEEVLVLGQVGGCEITVADLSI